MTAKESALVSGKLLDAIKDALIVAKHDAVRRECLDGFPESRLHWKAEAKRYEKASAKLRSEIEKIAKLNR